jgi:hypothetical protein
MMMMSIILLCVLPHGRLNDGPYNELIMYCSYKISLLLILLALNNNIIYKYSINIYILNSILADHLNVLRTYHHLLLLPLPLSS